MSPEPEVSEQDQAISDAIDNQKLKELLKAASDELIEHVKEHRSEEIDLSDLLHDLISLLNDEGVLGLWL